jgi:hypothetical protein
MAYFALRWPVRATKRTLSGTSRILPATLGLVLLTAAALKVHQLTTGRVGESSLFTSRWSLIGLIELELALGVWLLLGHYPRQARWLALACFSGFGAMSLQQGLTGKASCSCFGTLPLSPWYTFLFDLAAVAALWHWHPERNICAKRSGGRDSRLHPWRAVVFGLLFFLPAVILGASARSQGSAPALTVSPRTIDLGEVPAGGCREVAFSLTNSGAVPLTVARIETSCHCLAVELPNHPLAPKEQVTGHARLDLHAEPSFAGDLGIEVKGTDGSGAVLFTVVVNVEVRGS